MCKWVTSGWGSRKLFQLWDINWLLNGDMGARATTECVSVAWGPVAVEWPAVWCPLTHTHLICVFSQRLPDQKTFPDSVITDCFSVQPPLSAKTGTQFAPVLSYTEARLSSLKTLPNLTSHGWKEYIWSAKALWVPLFNTVSWAGSLGERHFSYIPTLSGTFHDQHHFSSVQLLSRVQLFVTSWTAARQASLSITNSQSLLKLMSIESVMPSNHLILCRPLLLLPSVFPSIRVFSSESVMCIGLPNY